MNAPALPADVGQIDRATYLGGSDIAAILGVSPWKTPLKVWQSKINGEDAPGPAKTAIFARGHRWEPVAREMLLDALEDRYGERPELLATNCRYIDIEHPFIAAEIDAEIMLQGEVVNVEIKTVHPFRAHEWGEEGSDEVPVHYVAQAMYGLGINTGRPPRRRCIVAALFGADSLVTYEIQRDEETIDAMRSRAVEFWHNNVLPCVEPEPSNMAEIMATLSKVNGKPVEADADTAERIRNMARIRASIKAMKGELEELEFSVCDHIRRAWSITEETPTTDDAVIMFDGKPLATWKKQRGTHLDQKALNADQPETVAQYTREHWFRAIRIKKQK
jgi:putative phage-type endonuclease